jgi:hypothetical protein
MHRSSLEDKRNKLGYQDLNNKLASLPIKKAASSYAVESTYEIFYHYTKSNSLIGCPFLPC